jgi:alpha-galactosidase
MTILQLQEIEQSPDKTKIVRDINLQIELTKHPLRYYRHGWQSWSLAAWTDLRPLPIQYPKIMHPLQVDPVYAFERKPHGSWLGAVEFEDGNILLLGALGLDAHVTLNDHRLSGQYDAGADEWFIAYGHESVVFEVYANLLGNRFGKIQKSITPRVWCSWYSLYGAIDEKILHKVFDELMDLPFDVLQVDDGWQMKVGDWEANKKFPSGMKALAEKIRSTGRKAGLWLAPLIALKSSRLFHEHRNWFLRNKKGRFVSAGFNWGEHLYALDTTHPEVSNWLAELMKQVRAWGYDYLKLDFLYGGALPGKRYKDMPREVAYRNALKVMREAIGEDTFLLTCGAPIIPSIGLCDAIRVGPDVAGSWESRRDAVLLYNPTIPGTRNAIRTTINMLWLSHLIQIDPDVAYFSTKNNTLTSEQKRLLQDLALVCKFKATSDLPQWLDEKDKEQLRAFLEDVTDIKPIGRYKFQIGHREVNFSKAIDLPHPPRGFEVIIAKLTGWLGSHPQILRLVNRLGNHWFERLKNEL